MVIFVSTLIGLALTVFIMSPFWLGEGGQLARSSTMTDPEKILKTKKIIVDRYLHEEAASKEGHITTSEWEKRKQYLLNRYIDLARRYDYLNYIKTVEHASQDEQGKD